MTIVKIYLGISLELFVEGNVGSVQFQIVPPSSLCLLSIGPLQCLVSANYRVLIWCSCHFQSGSLFFILASSVCKSLQCLTSALTQGGRGGQLFLLTCSVVLWGGRSTTNITGVCGDCLQCLGHTGLPHSWCVCFPGLHCSGSRLLCRGTV